MRQPSHVCKRTRTDFDFALLPWRSNDSDDDGKN